MGDFYWGSRVPFNGCVFALKPKQDSRHSFLSIYGPYWSTNLFWVSLSLEQVQPLASARGKSWPRLDHAPCQLNLDFCLLIRHQKLKKSLLGVPPCRWFNSSYGYCKRRRRNVSFSFSMSELFFDESNYYLIGYW